MQTFTHEISFLSKVAKQLDDNKLEWVDEVVVKTGLFKELNRTDKEQHKLHFKIIAIAENFGSAEDDSKNINISSDGIYDLTVKAINTLLIVSEGSFTAEDKKELLCDSGAILSLGLWLLKEKLMPFFLTFKMT